MKQKDKKKIYKSRALGWFCDEPYWGVIPDSGKPFIVLKNEIVAYFNRTEVGYAKYVTIVTESQFDKYVLYRLQDEK